MTRRFRGRNGLVLGVAALVASAFPMATALADPVNPVIDPIVDLGVEFELTPFVQIPDSTIGRPRVNAMATTADRIFVLEDYDGKIYELVDLTTTPNPELFFDVKAGIAAATARQLDNTNLFHGGLRGLAFHPDFANNGFFYTSVMESRPAVPNPADYLSDATTPIAADSVLIEWRFDHVLGSVDPSTYRQVFRVGMPVYDHPIKQIAFDPSAAPGAADYGLLYIAHGDGSVLSATAGGGANDDALGKILRIDPLASGSASYSVPAGNEFIGDPNMLDEVFSLGHRNPHHLAFANDGGQTHLISAEAGRSNVEEVNLVVSGGDYGWSAREGTFVHLEAGGLINGIAPLPADDAINDFIYPAAQMGHNGSPGDETTSEAIAGGFFVDNGSVLSGNYFYSDFPKTGAVFHSTLSELLSAVTSLDATDPNRDHPDELTQATVGSVAIMFDHDSDPSTAPLPRNNLLDVFDDAPSYDGSGRADVRFGQGPLGELYVLNKRNGWIYLVTNSMPAHCNRELVTVDLGAGESPTSGSDVILGTAGPDTISGLGGNDTICGLGGADTINGGNGADTILGGDGADVIGGQGGPDIIRGGNGDDRVYGGVGDDQIWGGAGADDLRGQGDDDTLWGGDGVDQFYGGSGDDHIHTGDGGNLGTSQVVRGQGNDDTIIGSAMNDLLEGGPGLDEIRGGSGNDHLIGGNAFDRLFGGDGADLLEGNAARDVLRGGDGADTLAGGPGPDDLLGESGDDTLDGQGDGPDLCDGGTNGETLGDIASATCEIPLNIP